MHPVHDDGESCARPGERRRRPELVGPVQHWFHGIRDFPAGICQWHALQDCGWGKVRFDAPDCRGPDSFRLMQEIHTLYFGEVQQKAIVGKIQGSNLGNQILLALQNQVQSSGTSPTKLVIFSGHDSNIANVAGLLGLKWKLPDLPDNDTPPAGALVFELSSDASNNYFVRVRYVHQTLTQLRTGVILSPANPPNWVDVEMPNCTPECKFSTFQQMMQAAVDPNLTTKTALGN